MQRSSQWNRYLTNLQKDRQVRQPQRLHLFGIFAWSFELLENDLLLIYRPNCAYPITVLERTVQHGARKFSFKIRSDQTP